MINSKEKYILGIDTSNYKTSIAIIDRNNNIICDYREFLKVKAGERGLRQSEAFFQHVLNIPKLIKKIETDIQSSLGAIAVSVKPRSTEGSYMPVFIAGESFADAMGGVMGIPVIKTSHQEGHIEAIRAFSRIEKVSEFTACHFSGGTSEVLSVTEKNSGDEFYNVEIIGGTKDIAMGQVLDRAGVLLGMRFPCGEEMDAMALEAECATEVLSRIKTVDGYFNLSGIDTQIKRFIEKQRDDDRGIDVACFVREIFDRLTDAVANSLRSVCNESSTDYVICAGGVTSSVYMKEKLIEKLNDRDMILYFDEKGLSSDNAVGTALLGGKRIWP